MLPTTASITGKKILITGGAGFIGLHLTKALSQENKVIIYDNFSSNQPTNAGKTSEQALEGAQLVRGDILDYETLKNSLRGVDLVFHLAAIAGVPNVRAHPLRTMEVNLIGTYNVLKAAGECRVERVLLSSTSEVYGPFVYLSKESDMTSQGALEESRWAYATSKLAGDFLARSFFVEKGLKTTMLRYFNIYGPGQRGEGAIHSFIVAAVRGEQLTVYGDGLQIRAWCYVDDAVRATLCAASNLRAVGKVFNIGTPASACTIRSLAEKVVNLTGSKSKIVYLPKKFADVELRVPDVSLARKLLKFESKIGLDEGIKLTYQHFRSQQ